MAGVQLAPVMHGSALVDGAFAASVVSLNDDGRRAAAGWMGVVGRAVSPVDLPRKLVHSKWESSGIGPDPNS